MTSLTSSPSCAFGEGHGYAARGRFLIIHHLCVQDARYTLRGIFLAGGIVTFRAIDRVFRESLVIAAHVQPSTFFPFSLSLFYQILLFFNFLRLHLLFLGHENDLLLEIDLCRCTVPFSRIFFKLLEIEEGGGGTNDRGYRNIFERGI